MAKQTSDSKPNVIGGVALILFIGTVIYLTITMGINDRMERDLRNEKLRSEMLLSEKLLEQKKRSALQIEFDALEKDYETTRTHLDEARTASANNARLVVAQEREIRKLKSSAQHNIMPLLEQQSQKDSLRFSHALDVLKIQVDNLNEELHARVTENDELKSALARVKREQLNNVSIDSRKRNQRLTVKGTRTKRIDVSMEVSKDVKDLILEIMDPAGSLLPLSKENLSITFSAIPGSAPDKKNVRMVYTSDKKLADGTYNVLIRSGSSFLGSFRMTLE